MIQPIPPNKDSITFGYHHPLKTAWKKGLLPTVTHGFYGEPLTNKNVSLEHLIPRSQGGHSNWANLVLADRQKNWERGVIPIDEVTTVGMLRKYLLQFKDVKNKYIDGNKYIKAIRETFKDIVDSD